MPHELAILTFIQAPDKSWFTRGYDADGLKVLEAHHADSLQEAMAEWLIANTDAITPHQAAPAAVAKRRRPGRP